jgi:hypothetical protein
MATTTPKKVIARMMARKSMVMEDGMRLIIFGEDVVKSMR